MEVDDYGEDAGILEVPSEEEDVPDAIGEDEEGLFGDASNLTENPLLKYFNVQKSTNRKDQTFINYQPIFHSLSRIYINLIHMLSQ